MCPLRNIAMRDYQGSVTTGQTDTRTDRRMDKVIQVTKKILSFWSKRSYQSRITIPVLKFQYIPHFTLSFGLTTHLLASFMPHSSEQYLDPTLAASIHPGPKHCLGPTPVSHSTNVPFGQFHPTLIRAVFGPHPRRLYTPRTKTLSGPYPGITV